MWVAIQEISYRCESLGALMESMYASGILGWGDPSPFSYGKSDTGSVSNPGRIDMDRNEYDLTDLEMLVEDLFHEMGHSVGGLLDDAEEFTDYHGREGMHYNDWDVYGAGQSCPTISPQPELRETS